MAIPTERAHDVIVIGGGVFGCAVAWNLARRGAGRVLLLERADVGMATTSRAAALITGMHTKRGQTALTTATRRAIPELEQELGQDLGLHRVGSLHLAASESNIAALEELVLAATECEEPFEWIAPSEAERRFAGLDASLAQRAAFFPDDSYLDPYRLAQAYCAAARAHGAEIRTGVPVTGFVSQEERVTGVRTPGGELHAGVVVDTAGPWAGLLTHELGIHLPMAPVRSHYWITAPSDLRPAQHPYLILPDAHAYARGELGGLLFGLRDQQSLALDPRELPPDLETLRFDEDPEGWDVLAESGAELARWLPELEQAPIAHYVAGPSTYTPDGQFVIGALQAISGLLVAGGCCGAGIAISGGVGEALAELALEGRSSFDLEPFRPERFGAVDAFSPEWLERCASARSRKTSG